MASNDIFSQLDLAKYVGQWVVVCNNKVIASNKNLTKIQDQINNCKGSPTVAKIPKRRTWIF